MRLGSRLGGGLVLAALLAACASQPSPDALRRMMQSPDWGGAGDIAPATAADEQAVRAARASYERQAAQAEARADRLAAESAPLAGAAVPASGGATLSRGVASAGMGPNGAVLVTAPATLAGT